ncbi:hypothetical protein B0G84_5403 [Paraburkholderia sp. BL8N3]|nr:hypothetical protein B0G84_5403 [Paraburkholderia sp. BL8N3]
MPGFRHEARDRDPARESTMTRRYSRLRHIQATRARTSRTAGCRAVAAARPAGRRELGCFSSDQAWFRAAPERVASTVSPCSKQPIRLRHTSANVVRSKACIQRIEALATLTRTGSRAGLLLHRHNAAPSPLIPLRIHATLPGTPFGRALASWYITLEPDGRITTRCSVDCCSFHDSSPLTWKGEAGVRRICIRKLKLS